MFEESIILLTRLCRLNDRVKTVLSSNEKFSSLIYVVISYFVKEHYSKQRNTILYELTLTFLIEYTSKSSLCIGLNRVINESVVIPEVPVISGSSADLLIVVMSHLVVETANYDPLIFNYIAIMRNV